MLQRAEQTEAGRQKIDPAPSRVVLRPAKQPRKGPTGTCSCLHIGGTAGPSFASSTPRSRCARFGSEYADLASYRQNWRQKQQQQNKPDFEGFFLCFPGEKFLLSSKVFRSSSVLARGAGSRLRSSTRRKICWCWRLTSSARSRSGENEKRIFRGIEAATHLRLSSSTARLSRILIAFVAAQPHKKHGKKQPTLSMCTQYRPILQ